MFDHRSIWGAGMPVQGSGGGWPGRGSTHHVVKAKWPGAGDRNKLCLHASAYKHPHTQINKKCNASLFN